MVHKPIPLKRCEEHSECRSRQRMGQVETSIGLRMGLQESQTQVRSGSTSEEGRTICSFRTLMDLCHLKHSELEKHLQSTRGESCSRDTSSKTTVASERYSRRQLQLRQWQQNSWMQFADSLAWRVQRRGIGLHAGAHVGGTRMRLKNLWFLPERNLYGHTLAGLLWERKLEEVLVKRAWERGAFTSAENHDQFLYVYVDDIKMVGKKENLIQMWKPHGKMSILKNRPLLLNHLHFGCFQREAVVDPHDHRHELAGDDPRTLLKRCVTGTRIPAGDTREWIECNLRPSRTTSTEPRITTSIQRRPRPSVAHSS